MSFIAEGSATASANRLSDVVTAFEQAANAAHNLLGTIYLPKGVLKIDVKGQVADLSAYTVIVTQRLEVKGANLVVNADYGGTDVPVPEGVGPLRPAGGHA